MDGALLLGDLVGVDSILPVRNMVHCCYPLSRSLVTPAAVAEEHPLPSRDALLGPSALCHCCR